MRNRSRLIAPAILATALITLAAAGGAALASGDGSGGGGHTRTLHFLLRETQQVVDRPPAGPTNGDLVLVRGELLNPRTRKAVGSEIGMYVMVDAAGEHRSAAQVVFTPGARSSLAQADQITMAGVFDSVPSKVVSAITGGTGRYQDARGQVVGRQGPDGLIDVVIHVRTS